jgi:hypothetical protein
MNRDDVVGANLRDNRLVGTHGSHTVRGQTPNPAGYATAGNVTYSVNDLLSGIIVRNPAGAARTDTLPTAAAIVAILPRANVADILRCLIINASVGAADVEQLTLAAGAGGAWNGQQGAAAQIIRSQCSKEIAIRILNVTPGAEAYQIYA